MMTNAPTLGTTSPPGGNSGPSVAATPVPPSLREKSEHSAIPSPLGASYVRNGKRVRRSAKHGVRNLPHEGVPLTPAEEEQIARMAVAGATKESIAKRLRRTQSAVRTVLAMPEIQTYMQQIREATRAVTLAGVHDTQAKAMGWLEETVDTKDAKAFDSVARGVFNLEKTAASASGETRAHIQVAVVNQQTESEEVKELIRVLALR